MYKVNSILLKVDSHSGFDFYIGIDSKTSRNFYNIVPANSPTPSTGYENRRYVERKHNVKFADRYQPTFHGTSETFLSDTGTGTIANFTGIWW